MVLLARPYVEDRASTTPLIDGSLIIDGNSSQRLKRTLSASGNRRTWTMSTWMKIVPSDNAAANHRGWFGADAGSASDASRFLCFVGDASDQLQLDLGGASVLDSYSRYRDPTGWYHHVLALATDFSAGEDQYKWYINGKLVNTWTTETAQTQYEELGWNNYASTHMIGANPAAGPGQWFDGVMAQFCHIDGQAVGPGYFGYTDPLTNTWTPKIFDWKGTTVNDGTVFSNGMTAAGSGGWKAGYGADQSFDGDLTTRARSSAPSNNGLVTFTAATPIPYKNSIRAYNGTGDATMYSATWSLNGGAATSIATTGWQTIATGSGKLTTLSTTRNGDGEYFSAIEVDGVIMIDGKGSGFNKNPNNGTVWSSHLTTNAGDNFDGSGAITKAFDGDGSTKCYTANNTDGTTTGTSYIEMVFPSAINGVLRVKCDNGNTVRNVTGGGDVLLATQSTGSDNRFVDCGTVSGLTNLRILMSGGSRPAIGIIELDGYVYIDGTVNNSFYLPMDGSAPIGEDQSGTEDSGSVSYKVFNNSTGTNINYFTDTPEATGILNSINSAVFSYTLTSKHAVFDLGPSTARRIIDEITGSGGWVLISDDGSTWTQLGSANISGTNTAYMPNFSSPKRYFSFGGGGGVGACTLTLDQTSSNRFVGNDWTPVNFGGSAPLDKATGGLPILNTLNGGNIANVGVRKDYAPDTLEIVKQSGCVAFDGSGDYLVVKNSSDLVFEEGSFTIECFVYIRSYMGLTYPTVISKYDNGDASWILRLKSDGDIVWYAGQVGGGTNNESTTQPISLGRWIHLAVVREGTGSSQTKVYVDGALQLTCTDSSDYDDTNDVYIGRQDSSNTNEFDGYISNVRIVKGTAVYTSDFTPPTSPLTNITNTKLLCCQSNNQSSSASVAPTVSGINDGTQWSAYMEPAGPTNFIKPGSYTQYTNFITNARRAFDGDLTTTCWADSATSSGSAGILNWEPPSPITISSTLRIYGTYHGTGVFYINGTSINSQLTQGASSSWFTITGFSSIENISLHGTNGSNTAHIRAIEVDGVVLIDPMTPYGDVYGSESEVSGSCVLALPLVGNAIDVSNSVNSGSATKAVTTNGDPTASSEQTNFYGGSFDFDGTGDYFNTSTSSTDFSFGTGDFTIEAWCFVDSGADNKGLWQLSTTSGGLVNTNSTLSCNYESDEFYFGSAGGWRQAGRTYPDNTWHHVAEVRSGGTISIYVDGVLDQSWSDTSTYDMTYWAVGGYYTTSYLWSGFIQDFRVYKGVCKYKSNFIPASKDPDIVSDSPSGAAYSTQLAKITNGAVSFDGTGDFLRIASSSDFDQNPGTDFTVECFFYMTEISGPSHIFGFQIDANNRTSLYFTNNTNDLNWWTSLSGSSGNRVSVSDVSINAWHHVAVTRSGSTTTMWLDGIGQGTSTTTDYPNGNQLLDIGTYNAGGSASDSFPGFISNVRYVKGTALYTGNFTPPTSPLTNITNTKLLCCQSTTSIMTPAVSPNGTTVWSDLTTADAAWTRGPTYAFNGVYVDNDGSTTAHPTGINKTITCDFTGKGLSGDVRIFAYTSTGTIYQQVKFDDGSWINVTGSSEGYYWFDAGDQGSFDIMYTKGLNNSGAYLGAVEVDGTVLVDPVGVSGDAAATNFNLFDTNIKTSLAESGGKYATWNPLVQGSAGAGTYQNSNLRWYSSGTWKSTTGTMAVSSGKWYYEQQVVGSVYGTASGNTAMGFGWAKADQPLTDEGIVSGSTQPPRITTFWNTGGYNNFGAYQATVCTPATGDVMATALDKDNNIVKYYLNGTEVLSLTLGDTTSELIPYVMGYYNSSYFNSNFGQKPFKYAPPQGFQPLNSASLPSPGVVTPDSVVGVTTYSGTTGAGTIKNDDIKFTPDFVWLKSTSNAEGNALYDTVRGSVGGNFYRLISNTTAAQAFPTNELSSMIPGGFTVNNNGHCYYDGYDYVAWMWKAGGPATPATDLVFGVNTSDNGFDTTNTTRTYDTTSFSFGSYSIPQDGDPGGYGANSAQVYKSSSGQLIKWSVSTTTASKYIWTSSDGINWSSPGSQYDTTTAPKNVTSKWIALSGGANAADITVTGDGHLFRKDGVGYASAAAAGLTAGSVTPTGASVGTRQGFSIIKWTAPDPQDNSATVPHGLTQKPEFWMVKSLDGTRNWLTYTEKIDGSLDFGNLNDNAIFNNSSATAPTTTTFGVYGNDINTAGEDQIAYLWHSVPGLQKFGKYEGLNSSNGPFIDLGFRPAIMIFKDIDAAQNWIIIDDKRSPYNLVLARLFPNSDLIEYTNADIGDFCSNGFRFRGNEAQFNNSETYVYAAWAADPSGNLYRGQSNAH